MANKKQQHEEKVEDDVAAAVAPGQPETPAEVGEQESPGPAEQPAATSEQPAPVALERPDERTPQPYVVTLTDAVRPHLLEVTLANAGSVTHVFRRGAPVLESEQARAAWDQQIAKRKAPLPAPIAEHRINLSPVAARQLAAQGWGVVPAKE